MNTKKILSMAVVLMSGLVLFNMMPSIAMADNPVPVTTSLSPSFALMGSPAFTLTVNGNNFVPGSFVNFNGGSRATTYISPTQLNASIPASDLNAIGTYNVTVTSPAPGGGTSNAQVFTVGNLVPTTTSITPSSMLPGSGGFTLTVNGTNFVPTSMVNFNGSPRSTTYVSGTQLNAAISTSDLSTPGSFTVSVTNPVPGGGTSNSQIFVVTGNNPVPTLTSIFPSSGMAGSGGFPMTVYGANFTPSSYVRFAGVARATTFVSPSQLTAMILPGDMVITGSYPVDVVNSVPGGGTSNTVFFTVSPVSTVPSLPNTGFGPSSSNVSMIVAAIALFGILLVAFGVRGALLNK